MPRAWPNILGLVNPGLDGIQAFNAQLGMLPGWVVFNRSMAHATQIYSGDDFLQFTNAEVGVICCLEWDHEEGGTIPAPGLVKPYLQRCQTYVEASSGCHVWVIGSEMNTAAKWPLTGHRAESIAPRMHSHQVLEPRYRPNRYPLLCQTPATKIQEGHFPISPGHYVDCYSQVRECIKALPGHEQDLVLVGAVAPWNTDAKDPDNPSGDWIQYFTAIATALPIGQCEGFALHTATLGPNPDLLRSDQKLSFPFGGYSAGFRCFEDFTAAVPPQHRRLPIFITEASQLQPWLDANDSWVFNACELIQDHNRSHVHSPIRCLSLFQWDTDSPWAIRGKSHLVTDIRDTLHMLADRDLKSALCAVVWERVEFPARIVAGQDITVSVTFANATAQRLCCSGDDPVRLAVAFQVVHLQETSEMQASNLRYPLPEDVDVGAVLTCQLKLPSPTEPGEYRILIGIGKTQFVWLAMELDGAFCGYIAIQDPESTESWPETFEAEDESELRFEEQHVSETPRPAAAARPLYAETSPPKKSDTLEKSDALEKLDTHEELDAHEELDTFEVSPQSPARTEVAVWDQPAETALDQVPTPPVKVEVVDLTAFFPARQNEKAVRLLSSLHRFVFIETGLSAHTPLDSQLDHFRELGLEGIPMHYMLENAGPVYQILPLTTVPLSYSRNLAPAIVLGLEGRAQSQVEAKERLLRAVQCSATILQGLSPLGLSQVWEIGMDSVDGKAPFSGLPLDCLAEMQGALHEQWRRLGMVHALELTPIDLPLESPLPNENPTDPDAETELAQERHGSPRDPNLALAGSLTPIEGETPVDDPLPMAPLITPFQPMPLDLDSEAAKGLEHAYRERTSCVVWAAGDTGTAPVAQLRRIHTLQYGDILYHFVIAPDGQIFETRRGSGPDEILQSPDSTALHIGLLGDFRHQFPAEAQTQGCSLLLARLTHGEERAADPDTPKSRPVRIGTEQWWRKEDWQHKVLLQASQLQDRMEEQKEVLAESEQGDGRSAPSPSTQEASFTSFPSEKDGDTSRPVALASPFEYLPLAARAPHIVNKIGAMPSHPRMQFPKRQLAAIRAICIHHSDAPGTVGPEQLTQSLILDHGARDMPLHALPYHFFVHPNGQTDQIATLDAVCHGITGDNEDNEHLISVGLAGKFTDTINPTPDQLKQAGLLLGWLMRKHFLSLDDIKGHKEIDAQESVCPGTEWNQGRTWKDSLFFYID